VAVVVLVDVAVLVDYWRRPSAYSGLFGERQSDFATRQTKIKAGAYFMGVQAGPGHDIVDLHCDQPALRWPLGCPGVGRSHGIGW
jgi:hypothetical protein